MISNLFPDWISKTLLRDRIRRYTFDFISPAPNSKLAIEGKYLSNLGHVKFFTISYDYVVKYFLTRIVKHSPTMGTTTFFTLAHGWIQCLTHRVLVLQKYCQRGIKVNYLTFTIKQSTYYWTSLCSYCWLSNTKVKKCESMVIYLLHHYLFRHNPRALAYNECGGPFDKHLRALKLGVLKLSPLNEIHMFQCMGTWHLKFHTNVLPIHWKMIFFLHKV